MTDVHCHVASGESGVREFLIGREFVGVHPWETLGDAAPEGGHCASACLRQLGFASADMRYGVEHVPSTLSTLRASLAANAALGVGEIGLDRLKEKTISPLMREVFESQLKLALEFNRPVVFHGAKCWGQVVKTIKKELLRCQPQPPTSTSLSYPTFLFHGFSRSDGLIPDIVKLNGYISVGPAVLNDHAVNYREMVKKIPLDRLVIETDRTVPPLSSGAGADTPSIREVLAKTAEIRGLSAAELEAITDENATRFIGCPC